MLTLKRLCLVTALVGISTSPAMPAEPRPASAQSKAPRNLWDHWQATPVPTRSVAGIAWDGRGICILSRPDRTIYRLDRRGGRAKYASFPRGTSPAGLAFDGKAFWTWDSRGGGFLSVSSNGSARRIRWSGKSCTALTFCAGKLLFTAPGDTKIRCLDTRTRKLTDEMPSPCRHLLDMTWDGRYLWCLEGTTELVGYDVKRRLPFTVVSLKTAAHWVAFAGDRFWTIRRTAAKLQAWSFPKPQNGDLCVGPPHPHVRVVAGGVFNPSRVESLKSMTVLFKKVPVDDIHLKLDNVSFNLPCETVEHGDVSRWLFFKNVTVPPNSFRSIHGTIRFSLRDCRHVIIPDDLPSLDTVPAHIRQEFLHPVEGMRDPDMLAASRSTKAYTEQNPYWKLRKVHDWILDHMKVGKPPKSKRCSDILRSGQAVCDGYKALMTTLCRLNGIPCQNHGAARPYTAHTWNSVYLPGGLGWVEIDVQLNERLPDSPFGYYRIKHLGWRHYAISSREPGEGFPSKTSVGSMEIPFSFPNSAYTADAEAHDRQYVKFDFESFHAARTADGPPACPLSPIRRATRDRYLELVWPSGYDLEDGSNLSYEIYASPSSILAGRKPHMVVDTVTTTRWRIKNLDPARMYYFQIIAVDSSGNRPDPRKKWQLSLSGVLLGKYVWNRKK